MAGILKYRIVAVSLALVFAVFNIGIPVVIASCSMPELMRGNNCPMCGDQDVPLSARFATAQNNPCCTMAVVAERNTAEFVQGKTGHADWGGALSLSLHADVLAVSALCCPASTVCRFSSSPPVVVDIPIRVSSLLI